MVMVGSTLYLNTQLGFKVYCSLLPLLLAAGVEQYQNFECVMCVCVCFHVFFFFKWNLCVYWSAVVVVHAYSMFLFVWTNCRNRKICFSLGIQLHFDVHIFGI